MKKFQDFINEPVVSAANFVQYMKDIILELAGKDLNEDQEPQDVLLRSIYKNFSQEEYDNEEDLFEDGSSILDYLNDKYDLCFNLESEDEEMDVPEEFIGEEVIEELLTQKTRKEKAIRRSRLKRLGSRAKTLSFKRSFQYDKKKKKFIKRKKVLDVKTLRKKARVFKRVTKKQSTKRKTQRTRKRFIRAPKFKFK